MTSSETKSLDAVTFEVLKNSYITIVDEMAEQILRTCHSFVIYSRDFSSALSDASGNTIAQGNQDLAAHVGTLHFTTKAIIAAFGDDIHPGDLFAVNDPYIGGTHFNDVRIVRPIFVDDNVIAYAQSNGHWADIGGGAPGSFDITAKEHFGEGLRITPVRISDEGRYRQDLIDLITANTRAPRDAEGDLLAQAEATRTAEREVLRLVGRYGAETVIAGFAEVQDYVERLTRQRVAELPNGTWHTEDYIDQDPGSAQEGLVPVCVTLEIRDDQIRYDLAGSHPAIGSFLNCCFGSSFSAVVAGTKAFFPDVPLNSGFYRVIDVEFGPAGSVVNAEWPTAVTGFASGPYEKIMNGIFELWSNIMPERAMACSFNIEYLLVGGRDTRSGRNDIFMWYDWMVGGWGGRNGRDGSNATASIFGVGLAVQPLEGQERLSPVLTTGHHILEDSAGPGKYRGGCGVEKGGVLTSAERSVVSYCCDRSRSISWGIQGGLPSLPSGVWVNRGREDNRYLGAVFSNVPLNAGDVFIRPSAGGGGFGDPLERDLDAVLEDVVDEYVTVDRARKDYGVVVECVDRDLGEYRVDVSGTEREREEIRNRRVRWLEEEAEAIADRYRQGELNALDLVRRYGVILDWGSGKLLPETTAKFREMFRRRIAAHWGSGETATPERAGRLTEPGRQ
jgi:N-methylhydantoinase B